MTHIEAGVGRIVLDAHGTDAIFTELSYAYPLKLLSPRLHQPKVAVVYVLSYGGGLVGGDQVDLSIEVQKDAILVVFTQGTTKVFKARPGRRPMARADTLLDPTVTRQRMHVSVPVNGGLFLLPEPVTCFRSAIYHQLQTIHLSTSASLVLLDWFTSGRVSLGEEWVFERYYSLNEVFVDGRRIARDATLLEAQSVSTVSKGLPHRALAERMSPYSCYATILLYGPHTLRIRDQLSAASQSTTIFKQMSRPNLLWSFSSLCGENGAILRVAALTLEDVRNWLKVALQGLEEVVGQDIYRKALG
ncbi:UreD-domain-containing protein [Cristinia sonorae]|uniref:UreD-domain-containing protein n=1 Tax=Cristinia sonorae TaxID=1940300 RepID=A0A8K0XRE6_9AGAR|nr:UreD-domain-containing protein [Cristinia sonorae]